MALGSERAAGIERIVLFSLSSGVALSQWTKGRPESSDGRRSVTGTQAVSLGLVLKPCDMRKTRVEQWPREASSILTSIPEVLK